jgi:hypothetical protein
MCAPMAAGAVMAGAQGANFIQQRQQARATNKFNDSQYGRNKEEALRAMVIELQGGQKRITEEQLAAEQAMLQLTRDAQEATGTVKASTTSTEGASIDALLRDYQRNELIRAGVAKKQLEINTGKITDSFEELRARTTSRISSGIAQPVASPNLLNAAIQIGTAGFQGYLAAGGGSLTSPGTTPPSTAPANVTYQGKY